MTTKNVNIWIWLQNSKIIKAISSVDKGTIRIYDENDNLILVRTGMTKLQVKKIENNILRYGAKRLNLHAEPFRFL